MKYVCPLLVVSDMGLSRKFYEEVLNQRVKVDFGENVTYEGDYALHLQSHYTNLIENKPIAFGGHDGEIYFEDDDLEALQARLQAADVEFLHTIREEPWKQRVLRFYDPDKHIIEVGETLELLSYRLNKSGMNAAEIAAATGIPEEHVVNMINKYIADHKA